MQGVGGKGAKTFLDLPLGLGEHFELYFGKFAVLIAFGFQLHGAVARLLKIGGAEIGRLTLQPGWRWSEHVKPIAKTDSCQAAHVGYFVSGRMKVVMDDGEELEFGPGDFATMAPGHDAWTVGDEPCVVIDWQGFADYAKRH